MKKGDKKPTSGGVAATSTKKTGRSDVNESENHLIELNQTFKGKTHDRHRITNSGNARSRRKIGWPHRDRHRSDSVRPDVSRLWPERIPELHSCAERHAAGNIERDRRVDESRLHDRRVRRGSTRRGAAPDESFRAAGAGAPGANCGRHHHISRRHAACHDWPGHRRPLDGTLSGVGVSWSVSLDAANTNQARRELNQAGKFAERTPCNISFEEKPP